MAIRAREFKRLMLAAVVAGLGTYAGAGEVPGASQWPRIPFAAAQFLHLRLRAAVMLRLMTMALCMAALSMALPAAADTLRGADPGRGADKVIALVRAQGCDYAKLEGRLAKAGKALASDSRTRRVIIDRPADPAHNPDLAGQPSPIVGALEVSAKQGTVKEIARKVRRQLGSVCRSDIYIVHERRLMARTRSWELGEASPETKVLVTMNRKPGVTKAEFVEEWTGPHAELSLDWRRRRGGPGHYVQNLVAETLGRDSPQLGGIGEIEGPRAAPPSEEERKARVQTATHAQTFQDMERSVMFVAREVILKD